MAKHQLTVDVTDIAGSPIAGLRVKISVDDPLSVVSPEGEVIVPRPVEALSDAQGIARFWLRPSSEVGTYRLSLDEHTFTFVMPGADADISELARGETIDPPDPTHTSAIDEVARRTAEAAQTTADAALPKAGGTMTGKITLDGAPTSDLHAATKKYVDAKAAAPDRASNADIDQETDNNDYVSVLGVFRAIARKVKKASPLSKAPCCL